MSDRPDRREAERDNHETEQAAGRCTFGNLCASCRWHYRQFGR